MSDSRAACFHLTWSSKPTTVSLTPTVSSLLANFTFAFVESSFVQINCSLHGVGTTAHAVLPGLILNRRIYLLKPVNIYVFPGCDLLLKIKMPCLDLSGSGFHHRLWGGV